jgi:hypothetical protein
MSIHLSARRNFRATRLRRRAGRDPARIIPRTPSGDSEEGDAHGATLTKHGTYLWVADRGRDVLWVVGKPGR